MPIHCPTHGKVRTVTPRPEKILDEHKTDSGGVPSFRMTFKADGDGGGAWFGHVNGGELRVEPDTEDDHVAVMQLAIEGVLSKPVAKEKAKQSTHKDSDGTERESVSIGPGDVGTLDGIL